MVAGGVGLCCDGPRADDGGGRCGGLRPIRTEAEETDTRTSGGARL